jgi:hypothetical protein
VGAAIRSLLLDLSYGIDGHEPEDVDAELLELIEPLGDAVEVSFRREGARKDLVDYGGLWPC